MLNLNKIKSNKNFCLHNKKYFNKTHSCKDAEILVEFNSFHASHIPFSYLSNCLSNIFKCKITAFYNYTLITSSLNPTILEKFKWHIANILNLKTFKIYRSFGAKKIFRPFKFENYKTQQNLQNLKKKINTKKKLLSLKIDNIKIGDLIYDTYLKRYQKPTIDFKDKKFHELFIDFIHLYFFWKMYLKVNKVKAVIGNHSVYSFGLILRIAIEKNIPTFVASNRFIYRLNKKMKYMHGQFKNYAEEFKKLDQKTRLKGINLAKKRLSLRFSGVGGAKVDLITSQNSSFKNINHKRLIKKNNKIKVLIAPHDFFDAAHIWGNMLFTDFHEWLVFLGEISKKTDYDWYIKNRPDHPGKFKRYQPHTNEILKNISAKYSKLNILPNNYSHNQIISEGIDFVLTCYGSVGMEYAYFKIPVINASYNNPHISYKFNINPRSVKDYKNILLKLDKYKFFKKRINKDEVIQYYFMRHLFLEKNWLIKDLNGMLKKVGGYDNQWSYHFYNYWLNNFNKNSHKNINSSLIKFINSNENYYSILHNTKNY